ncbi:MAG: hemerythrin family protein [Nitrosomonadales bacterium]|nr:hemerythrin family protein [Nitrosomonadales bacterium]
MTNSEPIQWSDALLTGVAEIDRQHRILVDTLNEAQVKLTSEADDPLFEQITRDLLAYAIYHFNTEEQLMQQHGYATASAEEARVHLAAHRSFSEQVVALRDKARAGKPGSREELLRFLKNWLTNHIMTTDKRLGQFISVHAKQHASGK